MTRSYDLIVIGAGMAGVSAANKCASQGWNVAIVDALPYGGTCALRGCDPKKILRRGAEIIDSARMMRGKGIDDVGLSVNWGDLMKHKHGFTDPVPQNMENSLLENGIDILHGVARFTDRNSIKIDGILYEATHFLIATRARPRPLDFPGHEHLVDSTDFLDLEVLRRGSCSSGVASSPSSSPTSARVPAVPRSSSTAGPVPSRGSTPTWSSS